jgi:hypothetical protein
MKFSQAAIFNIQEFIITSTGLLWHIRVFPKLFIMGQIMEGCLESHHSPVNCILIEKRWSISALPASRSNRGEQSTTIFAGHS